MAKEQFDTAMPNSSKPDPFACWESQQLQLGELTSASVAKYLPLWNAWRAWLAARQIPWDQVNGDLILEFLSGPAPGTGQRRRAINPTSMSSYTKQRYFRLLRGVYAVAVKESLIGQNPVLDVPDALRPSIRQSDRQSQVLEPYVFSELRKAETLMKLLPLTSADDWWHVRDRALIAVLVSTGITTSELMALRGMDVSTRNQRTPQSPLEFEHSKVDETTHIDVMQTAELVGRSLPVAGELRVLLQDWVERRGTLLKERAARVVPLHLRTELLNQYDIQGPLFLARRSKSSTEPLPGMDAMSVYHTVSRTLKALRRQIGAQSGGTQFPYVAKGAAVVRNSVLRYWLDTCGVETTLTLSGLRSVDSLRLPVAPK